MSRQPERPARRGDGHFDASRLLGAAGLAIGFGLLVPALALAHPLGNFTINHYAGIRVEPGRVILDVVIDQAEIPTFQERQLNRRRRRWRGLGRGDRA